MFSMLNWKLTTPPGEGGVSAVFTDLQLTQRLFTGSVQQETKVAASNGMLLAREQTQRL